MDEANLAADGTLASAGELVADRIFHPISRGAASAAGQAQKTPGNGGQRAAADQARRAVSGGARTAAKAAKTGFLHTAAGKAVAIVLGLGVSGGAVFGVTQMLREEPEAVQETDEREPDPAREERSEPAEVRDAQYPDLVAGNLTKEELEFVLAYGPEEIPDGGFEDSDYTNILNAMVQTSEENGNPIEDYGVDESWRSQYSVEDINRLFSSFTDYQFTEENDSDTEYGLNVDGDRLVFSPATINYSVSAEITSAAYTEDEMDVYYTYIYTSQSVDDPDAGIPVPTEKKAVLEPDEEGMYRIVSIEEAEQGGADDTETEQGASEPARFSWTV